jgi:hypothetical protein
MTGLPLLRELAAPKRQQPRPCCPAQAALVALWSMNPVLEQAMEF